MNLTIPLLAMSSSVTLFDALIIGAGPAGLSTATGLARQLHTAIVFDSAVYRNARAEHMHNVLGWDHFSPAKLREKGRADLLARYQTVKFADVAVASIQKMIIGKGTSGDGRNSSEDAKKELSIFEAVDVTGRAWHGRKVVLATGVKDRMLDIEGFDECWGRGMYVRSI
jgi:thioredoxin reductase